jgi:hypothetical protein
MTGRIPPEAGRALDAGILCHLAARVEGRPHLTPVVFVSDGGRLWLTTARSSAKARAWRADPVVAGLVRSPDAFVVFRGVVRTYDAFDPMSWPAATVRAPRILRAGARFSMKNARFFAGYAADARRVPLAWTPPGRVFAEVRLTAGRVYAHDGTPGPAWGPWREEEPTYARGYRALPRRRSLDLGVPASIRRALGSEGTAAMALDVSGRLTVIPVRWRRVGAQGVHEAVSTSALAALTGVRVTAPAALAIDRASHWRASAMMGMLLQGSARAFAAETNGGVRSVLERRVRRFDLRDWEGRSIAMFRIRPDRVVWWEGWTSGTVTAR